MAGEEGPQADVGVAVADADCLADGDEASSAVRGCEPLVGETSTGGAMHRSDDAMWVWMGSRPAPLWVRVGTRLATDTSTGGATRWCGDAMWVWVVVG